MTKAHIPKFPNYAGKCRGGSMDGQWVVHIRDHFRIPLPILPAEQLKPPPPEEDVISGKWRPALVQEYQYVHYMDCYSQGVRVPCINQTNNEYVGFWKHQEV